MFVTLTAALNYRTSIIHKNPSPENDATELADTAASNHNQSTIRAQPQEQNAEFHENPSENVQIRATESHYSTDSSTKSTSTHCTADHVQ